MFISARLSLYQLGKFCQLSHCDAGAGQIALCILTRLIELQDAAATGRSTRSVPAKSSRSRASPEQAGQTIASYLPGQVVASLLGSSY